MPRTYDREFKLETVRMVSEPGVTASEVEKRPLDFMLLAVPR